MVDHDALQPIMCAVLCCAACGSKSWFMVTNPIAIKLSLFEPPPNLITIKSVICTDTKVIHDFFIRHHKARGSINKNILASISVPGYVSNKYNRFSYAREASERAYSPFNVNSHIWQRVLYTCVCVYVCVDQINHS